ncbi:MAG TPA: hypothetical protein VEX18_14875, partial [Polyangiaceae bacterium]|nr:hypothetical protein [Polyangiaceae bacterium]
FGCSTTNDNSPKPGATCTTNAQCLNGQECSAGKCVPFTSCPATACASGQSCVAGVCRAACTSDQQCGALICDEAQGVCQPAPVGGGGTPGAGGSPAVGGTGGTPGGGGTPSSGGSAGNAGSGGGSDLPCSLDPNLALHGGWVGCDPALPTDNPMGLQGSIYMYHDGSSCTSPVEACGATGCCIKGATVVDATFAKWGCGIGFELNSTGGDAPTKAAYAGAVKCFDIKLTGSSGGNAVRIAYTQSDMMDGKVAPFLELAPLTAGFTGTVCFEDVTCPTEWMPAPDCMLGGPFDLQIQVVGANVAGAFDMCLTELVPHDGSGAGLVSLGQICGLVGENEMEHLTAGPYRIQNNVFMAGTGAQCITAKAGGGAAAFTIDSSSLSTGGNTPVAYPSVVYGWHFGQVTTGSGLPKLLSAITSAPSTVAYTAPPGGKYNAAYDIWAMPADKGANPTTPSGGVEIMIWLAAGGGPQPIGASTGESITVDGVEYDIWTGTNTDWQVVSFWAKSFVAGFTDQDLKPFIDKTVSLGKAQASWNLHSIQFGFEIWNGAAGGAVTNFKQAVN